eukprot:TRINITY_DN9898_c0_g2_i1.p2 TRINITY_DN9898_c0_g2~~TRINITY_DN9898_c0_g2_i1.p2  ORF type:complete len:207 (+),score=73.91 TRINITY_DN9898_c0_g2_i1:91-621(+)
MALRRAAAAVRPLLSCARCLPPSAAAGAPSRRSMQPPQRSAGARRCVAQGGCCPAPPTDWTKEQYFAAIAATIDAVSENVDALDSELVDDVLHDDGVLQIKTTDGRVWLLSRQAPKQQLWLSSPVSGPHHFNLVPLQSGGVAWQADTGVEFAPLLQKELGEALQAELELPTTPRPP